jgi:hypothetical protein
MIMRNYLVIILILANTITYAQTATTGRIFLSHDQGDSWERADNGFPENGSINSWVVSGTKVIAGTEDHGIFISEDGLKTWHSSNKGLPDNLKVNAVVVHKNLLLAGSYIYGVFVSYDEGATWRSFNRGLEKSKLTNPWQRMPFVSSIRCFYSIGNKLLTGTDGGIYSLEDDGSWTNEFQEAQINAFTTIGNNLYAGTNQGALRSQDAGKTWSWIWKKGAIFGFAAKGSNLVSFASADHIYEGWNEGTSWINLNTNFAPPVTFHITPSSGAKLIYPWENVFRSLRNKEPFRSNGLPDNASFMEILETPFGILVGVSFDGC